MANEEQNPDPEVELARLNVERRLMEQLVESRGWKHLAGVVKEAVDLLRERGDKDFLQITFGETKLDGIQSLVYEGYAKGIRAGMDQVLKIPSNLITHNNDAAKIEQLKIDRNKENEDGSSPDDSSGEFAGSERLYDESDIARGDAP